MNYRAFIFVIPFFLSPILCQCPPCKTLQSCTTSTDSGNFLLTEANSAYCPTNQGYTGCLYRKNGTSEAFCFKSGPSGQCSSYYEDCQTSLTSTPELDLDLDTDEDYDINNKVITVTPEVPCHDKFPALANMSGPEVSGLCCDPSDCQVNAGCFLSELSPYFLTYCSCYLGYYLDSTSSLTLPKTGSCVSLASSGCSSSSACLSEPPYTVCPYCSVTIEGNTIGLYTDGKGDLLTNDPMIFIGSSASCPEETTEMFWYCWYDISDSVVDLSQTMLTIEEHGPCERVAYVYTPLACEFANQQ